MGSGLGLGAAAAASVDGVDDGAGVGRGNGVGDAVGTKRAFGLGSAATADALCWGLGWRVFTTDRLFGAAAFASTIDAKARATSRSLIRVLVIGLPRQTAQFYPIYEMAA
jgi:hypothetical protein